jgi:hypothetical protein
MHNHPCQAENSNLLRTSLVGRRISYFSKMVDSVIVVTIDYDGLPYRTLPFVPLPEQTNNKLTQRNTSNEWSELLVVVLLVVVLGVYTIQYPYIEVPALRFLLLPYVP